LGEPTKKLLIEVKCFISFCRLGLNSPPRAKMPADYKELFEKKKAFIAIMQMDCEKV
jgi:hypothetical protein